MVRISSRILVVAATARELASSDSWSSLECGVGPVEAAIATAQALARERPLAVLHVGIAGARRDSGLTPGSMVIGSEALYSDLGVPEDWAPNRIEAPMILIAGIKRFFPHAITLPIGTSGYVGGGGGGGGGGVEGGAGWNIDVEAMEGFAVMRAAQHAGVPAIEVRAISNEIEERDRTLWQFEKAFEAITSATPLLVAALHEALRRSCTNA